MPKFTPDKLGFGQPNASVDTGPNFQVTGGSKYTPGDGYIYHIFTHPNGAHGPTGYSPHPATLSIQDAPGSMVVDALILGGGGGGGHDAGGGGGGGSAVEYVNYPVSSTDYAVTVGCKGAGGQTAGRYSPEGLGPIGPQDTPGQNSSGEPGGTSSLFGLTVNGGGGGGRGQSGTGSQNGWQDGRPRGGGGGGAYSTSGSQGEGGSAGPQPAPSPFATGYGPGQGAPGLNTIETAGGGAGINGVNVGRSDGGPPYQNQNGGEGRPFVTRWANVGPVIGAPNTGPEGVFVGGGGGGGGWNSSNHVDGQKGQGGAGAGGGWGTPNNKGGPLVGYPGTNNTGGGAGGGNQDAGGEGGSGVVMVRYSTSTG